MYFRLMVLESQTALCVRPHQHAFVDGLRRKRLPEAHDEIALEIGQGQRTEIRVHAIRVVTGHFVLVLVDLHVALDAQSRRFGTNGPKDGPFRKSQFFHGAGCSGSKSSKTFLWRPSSVRLQIDPCLPYERRAKPFSTSRGCWSSTSRR